MDGQMVCLTSKKNHEISTYFLLNVKIFEKLLMKMSVQ